MSVNSENLAG